MRIGWQERVGGSRWPPMMRTELGAGWPPEISRIRALLAHRESRATLIDFRAADASSRVECKRSSLGAEMWLQGVSEQGNEDERRR